MTALLPAFLAHHGGQKWAKATAALGLRRGVLLPGCLSSLDLSGDVCEAGIAALHHLRDPIRHSWHSGFIMHLLKRRSGWGMVWR